MSLSSNNLESKAQKNINSTRLSAVAQERVGVKQSLAPSVPKEHVSLLGDGRLSKGPSVYLNPLHTEAVPTLRKSPGN